MDHNGHSANLRNEEEAQRDLRASETVNLLQMNPRIHKRILSYFKLFFAQKKGPRTYAANLSI